MKGIKSFGWFAGLYISNIAMWLDVGLNVFIFFGKWNETLSSHLGRCFPNSLIAKIIDKLCFWQKVRSHCQNAVLPYITEDNDLIPKVKAEERVIQIIIIVFIIFFILKVIFIK